MSATQERRERSKYACCSCGVDTITERRKGCMISHDAHKDWCLFAAIFHLSESINSKPWPLATEDLRKICLKYANRNKKRKRRRP